MLQDANQIERVLGSRGRSCEQWDIWAAVYGPQADDGTGHRCLRKCRG